ncbi:PTS system glucose-specific EIICBA component [compost metagenome]
MLGWFKKKDADTEHIAEQVTKIVLTAPVQGTVVSLEKVPDEAFSSKAMGEGFAIEPSKGEVTAPFDGKVTHIMEKSKHAIVLEHHTGVQVLIHVGINTVSLKGDGFNLHVHSEDKVKQGQLLLSFDINKIQNAGYPTITPFLVPDGQDQVGRVTVNLETTDLAQTPTIIVHIKK